MILCYNWLFSLLHISSNAFLKRSDISYCVNFFYVRLWNCRLNVYDTYGYDRMIQKNLDVYVLPKRLEIFRWVCAVCDASYINAIAKTYTLKHFIVHIWGVMGVIHIRLLYDRDEFLRQCIIGIISSNFPLFLWRQILDILDIENWITKIRSI